MKPRLESAPATEEDRRIWRFVCCFYWHERYQTQFCAESQAQRADRRDADLMLTIEGRKLGLPGRLPHLYYAAPTVETLQWFAAYV